MSQLENLMKLGISEAEARQVLEDDKKIDKGEIMPFDLSKEQKKATRQYRQSDRKSFVPHTMPKERKPNNDRRVLIQLFNDVLINAVESIKITNAERQIDFIFNNTKYRIVLSAPRK